MSMQEMNEVEARAIFLKDSDEEERGEAPRAAFPFGRGAVALAALLAMAGAATLALFHSGASSPAFLGGHAAEEPLLGMVASSRVAGFDTKGVDPCDGLPFLKLVDVEHSNLGNQGPDSGEEGLIYKGQNTITEEKVYLHIHAKSDYSPKDAAQNGFHGRYGTINLLGGTKVDLVFELYDKDKNPKTVDKAFLTFFDLDTGSDGETTEYVDVQTYHKAIYQAETELKETQFKPGHSEFKASTEGSGSDNPDDPSILTDQQKNRAVTFEFQNFQTAKITIGSTKGPLPRWFMFVLRPSLLCAIIKGETGADNVAVVHGYDHTSHAPATTVQATTTTTTEETTTTKGYTEEIGAKEDIKEHMYQCCMLPGVMCGEHKWWFWCANKE